MNPHWKELEHKLDYSFQDRDLLSLALTHKSRAFEKHARATARDSNERLEFLGDAVLGFLVSEALVAQFPDLSEGQLSKATSRLVSSDHLHEVALRLGLGTFLLLGRGEEMSGGRTKRTLLADSMEALIAAIYLDGGYAAARRFVLDHVVGDMDELFAGENEVTDFKGALQELVQARKLPPPRYRVVATGGPEHSKRFTVEVEVAGEKTARAEGSSKKTAQQQAAALLLEQLRDLSPPAR